MNATELLSISNAQDLQRAATKLWHAGKNAGEGRSFDGTDCAGTSKVLEAYSDDEVDVRVDDETGAAILIATDSDGKGWAVWVA